MSRLRTKAAPFVPPKWRLLLHHLERVAKDPWQVLRLTIRISALCLFVTLLLSHDLWFQENRIYLPSPILEWTARAPAALNVLLYYWMLTCSATLFLFPEARRIAFFLVPAFLFLVLQDQLRGQFFVNMYMFNLFVAAALPRKLKDKHLDPLRYMTIGVYFWAGFYKINMTFAKLVFPWFVSPWFPFKEFAQAVGLLVPFLEAGIGVLLFIPKTRNIGMLLAASMLIVVLLSLGPLGHNQALPVWPANVYLDCLAVFLFIGNKRPLFDKKNIRKPLPALSAFLFLLLPLFGAPGISGNYPSYKLYCCVHYAELEFGKNEDLSFLPPAIAAAVDERNRLSSSAVTFDRFHVSSANFMPGDKPYIDGMKGFCPHLLKPAEAKLHVLNSPYLWSTHGTERVYIICEAR